MKTLWLFLLLTLPVLAQNTVRFETDPPNLQVYEYVVDGIGGNLSPLGRSGTPIEMPARGRKLIQFGFGSYVDPKRHTVDLARATRDQRWPAEGSVKVELPWKVWLAYQQSERLIWWELGAVLGLGGYAFLRRLQNQAHRARQLDSLKATITDEDPNLFKVIGGYRLVSRLGSGGMADVYRAVPNDTLKEDDAVAIKLIQRQASQSEEFRARFRREAEVGSRLSHASIIRVLDAGDQDGLLYITMELIQGHPLRDELKAGGRKDYWKLLGPIMEALEFAHAQGVVHRDLKPDNIMVTPRGRVVVMDFGLARRHDFSTVTASGSVLGTPAYMAPEQIQGLPLDEASDQYALGVMACELIMGRRPYPEHSDPVQVILQHLSAEPDVTEAPQALQPLLLKMLEKEPAKRFKDLGECRRAFEKAV